MEWRWIAVVPFGWMALLVFGAMYVAPTMLAVADAYGRPAHEWPKPSRRTLWLSALVASFPAALFGAAQVLALVYALAVARRLRSPEATAGALAARRRAVGGFAAGAAVLGPLFVIASPSDSNDLLYTIAGTCCILAATSFTALLYDDAHASPARRVKVVTGLVVVATLAGIVVRAGAVNACMHGSGPQGRWCRDPYGNSLWIPFAYAAGGAVPALWVTRPRKHTEALPRASSRSAQPGPPASGA